MDWWQRRALRTKIVLFTSGLLVLSFVVGIFLMGYSIRGAVVNELGRRTMSVGRTVAQVEAIRKNLGQPGGEREIQSAAERMRLATGVEYIVTFDRNRIRYSHPLPELIGTRFEGGDEGPSLSQQAYVSRARGVNGEAVRAFVPVMSLDGTEQVGVVVVGIMVPPMVSLLKDWSLHPTIGMVSALIIAFLGAWVLAASVKRQMFDLEPPEIARILEERSAILAAVGEGLVAISPTGRITVINAEAQRILRCGLESVGRHLTEVVPSARLMETVRSGQAEYNQQVLLGDTLVVINRVPVRVKDQIVGAVATFRDRTELYQLAEQLTGATRFTEALRAQNHETLNRLHTIAGLIRLREYNQALEYIYQTTEQQQGVSRFLAKHIKDHRVAGLLLGKVIRGRELGVNLIIDRQSRLDAIPHPLDGNDLVTILGNLIENAMEALAGTEGERHVECLLLADEHQMLITVANTGPGISPETQEAIFRRGFSTKGEHRGIGLALVKELVDLAGGRITVESDQEETVFTIAVGEEARDGADSRPDHR